jgi:hypothetical protein
MADAGRDEAAGLQALAAQTAGARGHELGEWTTNAVDSALAGTALCRRCGLPVHVRVEGGGLSGLAGAALTTPCTPGSPVRFA